MRSALFSESGETVRAEKSSFNCIRTGSEPAGAIMALEGRLRLQQGGKRFRRRPAESRPRGRSRKKYERSWKSGEASKREIMGETEEVRRVAVGWRSFQAVWQ